MFIRVNHDDSGVSVAVQDQGPGVPVEHRTRIWEAFGQSQVAESGRVRSSGLGLAFCRLAIQAHGGQTGLSDPDQGSGSVFWFKVPFESLQENVAPQIATEPVSQLDPAAKTYLRPFLAEMSQLEAYEVSAWRQLLKRIQTQAPASARTWLDAMEMAISSLNESEIQDLLQQIRS